MAILQTTQPFMEKFLNKLVHQGTQYLILNSYLPVILSSTIMLRYYDFQ